MRCRFNRRRYWRRQLAGEFTRRLNRDKHPAPPASGQPHCTRSQNISYLDAEGREIARVHQYLRPDGTLGGSGKPDPKRLFENGILYRQMKDAGDSEPADPSFNHFLATLKHWLMRVWGPIRCALLGR